MFVGINVFFFVFLRKRSQVKLDWMVENGKRSWLYHQVFKTRYMEEVILSLKTFYVHFDVDLPRNK